MLILAMDPGPMQTAWCAYDTSSRIPLAWKKRPNHDLGLFVEHYDAVVIEMIASYGMPVGAEVFETCIYIGRLLDRMEPRTNSISRLTRSMCKLHLCRSVRANDATVWQAILDRYGGKDVAIGKKKHPGPLYGLHGDCRAALAVAITAAETTERYVWPRITENP